ncbi:hypothetical protein J15TS10_35520 [Paenibacillus woosongensis]|uniref:Uncharacterized protein n=2 Tax=Paenibacillus woosongensis TaxID=307580 RepID=A0ABQ4MUX1_9BACL|nr:hypothetical protein J15TS10_35520 [Paenibacillus woosongensis]
MLASGFASGYTDYTLTELINGRRPTFREAVTVGAQSAMFSGFLVGLRPVKNALQDLFTKGIKPSTSSRQPHIEPKKEPVESGENKRFTGSGMKDYDKAAEAEYELIRRMKMNDIEDVARNTGLSIDEIRTIKKHLFFGKHQIPQPGGREFRLERFAADDEIAFAWKTAQKGELSTEQKAWFKQLAEHELAERKFMAAGQKYRTLESWNHEKGTYDGFPPGAHENALPQPNKAFPGYEEYFFNNMFK